MNKEASNNHSNNISSVREKSGGGGDGSWSLLLRGSSESVRHTSTTSDLGLRWGNRKRLRRMKVQVKDDASGPIQRTTVRVDRRVVRTDNKDSSNQPTSSLFNSSNNYNNNNQSNVYPNLRQRPPSPQQPCHRILRFMSAAKFRAGQTVWEEGNV